MNVVALLPDEIVADDGTLSRTESLLASVTAVLLATDCVSVAVQVALGEAGNEIALGLHVKFDTSTATLSVKLWLDPYPLAVNVAEWSKDVKLPEFTAKVAEVNPAGTLTEAGGLSTDAVEVSAKNSGAVEELAMVTEQDAVELLPMVCVPETLGSVQLKDVSGTEGTTVNDDVCETPL